MTHSSFEEVFLIHHGSQEYLQIAARVSQASGNKVILIGNDPQTGSLCSAYYDDTQIDLPDYRDFEANYVHLSSASEEFELLCFKRYFYLHAIAKQRGLDHFWMIDSDAVVLQNLCAITRDFLLPQGYCAGVSTKDQNALDWASSPHTSFWTLLGLEDFLSFLKNLYSNKMQPLLSQKYQWHQENNIPGGICDMTALYLWQQGKDDVCNLAKVHTNGMPLFDNNLNEDGNMWRNEFAMVKNVGLKKIIHKNNAYWAIAENTSTEISVAALHFQGRAKGCMAIFEKSQKITYWTYAKHAFSLYLEKRMNSFKRKLKKFIRSH